ncbi:undecaprenyl-diphosphatase [Metabacillus idriensis]|uniref:Phosphatase PAP2 family protein n=1 Tax=Metabacillus idriensis TaxID=324768 RepID=A0A6I2M7G8_9BACI|nr:undecaprenyl-diphosphatase [Metabacillus idriensis]MCM3594702.1 undecaprenyl-diphosphatase [Metabacillus idriensis]MRX53274.1 phosphatase PAP2 family protein [Metabacillus idriensis]OHR68635.1 undecaprenyl-diphosphatase [Bacillus sp. HMSC76G11]
MNYKVFKAINQLSGRCSPIDLLMIWISKNIRYVFIYVLIFMGVKNDFYKEVTRKALISVLVTLVINTLVKLFYFKPRPFVKRRVGILIPSKVDSSFPSKHTLLVFAISASIFLYDRILGSIMGILSVLTGFSRIWVGHHYPSDIIGSAFIGTIASVILDKFTRCANYLVRQ